MCIHLPTLLLRLAGTVDGYIYDDLMCVVPAARLAAVPILACIIDGVLDGPAVGCRRMLDGTAADE